MTTNVADDCGTKSPDYTSPELSNLFCHKSPGGRVQGVSLVWCVTCFARDSFATALCCIMSPHACSPHVTMMSMNYAADVGSPTQNTINARGLDRPRSAEPAASLRLEGSSLSATRPKSAHPGRSSSRLHRRQPAVVPSRTHAQLENLPPALWSPADVGTWITSIGMQQYKKHFVHNAVDGALLLEMDLEILKTELKIAPLGHRVFINSSIQGLMHQSNGAPNVFPSPPRLKPGGYGLLESTLFDKISRQYKANYW
jgi:hypothetical protein